MKFVKIAPCLVGISQVVVLDSNIYIYLSNGTLPSEVVADVDMAYATVTKIESLGYSKLAARDLLLLTKLFKGSYSLQLSDTIVDSAVQLRQQKRMSLGDAIVAATALEHDATLWTHNTEDFQHISELKLFDPLRS